MKNPSRLVYAALILSAGLLLMPSAAFAQAGPPAAGGAPGARGGGGRGGAPAGPVFSIPQMVAVRTMDIPAALTAAVTTARTSLAQVSLTLPRDDKKISAAAKDLADAELKLASAKAAAFVKLQASPEKLNAEQVTFVAGGGSPGGGGGLSAPGGTMAYDNYAGFTKIFDGKTFTGWDGETDVWNIEDESLHDDNSAGRPTAGQQHHIHYVGAGNILKDFDFKVEMKMTGNGANGGIQYRSVLMSGLHATDKEPKPTGTSSTQRSWASALADPMGKALPASIKSMKDVWAAKLLPDGVGTQGVGNPWQVSGYQFDMNGGNNFTGQLYEGQGRSIVTAPGEIVELFPGGLKFTIGKVSDVPVSTFVKPLGEWNQLEIIARGNTLVHMMNGHVFSVTIDDDPARRSSQGILSVQLEGTGQIWYRNLYLKKL